MALPHESLVVWQRADDLYVRIHALSKTFPPDERYGLTSQLRRAAYSVPANIVEGFGRYSPRDRAHFLEIALSSLGELGYGLHVSRRLEYISEDVERQLQIALRSVDAPLRGLRQRYLARRE
jgi:four helix bundle protein